jgi:hypothetical protein
MTETGTSIAPPHDQFEPFAPAHVPIDLVPPAPIGRGASLTHWLRGAFERRPGPPSRLGRGGILAVLAVVGLVAVAATDQVVPASSAHQAQLRIWVASRAAGIAAMTLLGVQILIGLVLSHPTNKTTWRLSRAIFPWHDSLWLFVLAFIAIHVVAIVVDPYAGVGLAGALIPGLSSYRSTPVALGTLALYALLVTGITARWTRLLPRGAWLLIHRAAAAIFLIAWMHGMLAGTDSTPLLALYLGLGLAILAATAHRVWTGGSAFEEVSR